MVWNSELQRFLIIRLVTLHMDKIDRRNHRFSSLSLVCCLFRSIVFTIFHRVQWIQWTRKGILNCNSSFYNSSFWLHCTRIKSISLVLLPFTLFLDLSLQFFTESPNKKIIYKHINAGLKFWTATFTIHLATFWISFRYHYNSSGRRIRE